MAARSSSSAETTTADEPVVEPVPEEQPVVEGDGDQPEGQNTDTELVTNQGAPPADVADATVLPEDQDPKLDDAAPGVTPDQQREDSEKFADELIGQLEGRRLTAGAAHRIISAVRGIKV